MIEVGKRVRIVGAGYWESCRDLIGTYGHIFGYTGYEDYPYHVMLDKHDLLVGYLWLTDKEFEVVDAATSLWADPTTLRGQIEKIIDPITSGGANSELIREVVDQLLDMITNSKSLQQM